MKDFFKLLFFIVLIFLSVVSPQTDALVSYNLIELCCCFDCQETFLFLNQLLNSRSHVNKLENYVKVLEVRRPTVLLNFHNKSHLIGPPSG